MEITRKQKVIIAIGLILAMAIGIGIYNIGAEERNLRNILEYKGYVKSADGLYRMQEINKENGVTYVVHKTFDVRKNIGYTEIITYDECINGKKLPLSHEVEELTWDSKNYTFEVLSVKLK